MANVHEKQKETATTRKAAAELARKNAETFGTELPPQPDKPKRGRPPQDREGIFIPTTPTNGADLMALWDLPVPAYKGGRLKITRRRYASLEHELVGESSVEAYEMGDISRDYGPGDYYLYLSADPQKLWKPRNCKISVSPEYAAASGYQTYPVQSVPQQHDPALPRISEARALQATASALDGTKPLLVGDLASLVEMVADKTARAIRDQAPPSMGMGPESMMTLWTALNQMQAQAEERTLKLMSRFQGKDRDEDEQKPEPTWADAIMKSLPVLLSILQPKPAEPAPVPVQNQQPAIQEQQQPLQQEDPMGQRIELPMSKEEVESFAGATFMLRPFVPLMLQMIKENPDVDALAQELADYIPIKLEAQMIELAKLAKERGAKVLNVISPELATEQGVKLVAEIAKILQDSQPV